MWGWQEVGSAAGLITAAFTFYDRLIRGRPEAILEISGPQGDRFFAARIKNVGAGTVLIRNVRTFPRVYALSKDDSLQGVVSGVVGAAPLMHQLDPGQSKAFPLLRRSEQDGRAFVIVCSWRKSSSYWLPQIPKFIVTSGRHLRYISKNY